MWDDKYSDEEWVYGTEPNDFLAQTYAAIPHAGNVLCLAEGEGRNAVFLAEKGFDVTGVDASEVGLSKATKLAADRGVHVSLVNSAIESYDLGENRWHGVVSVFAHFPSAIRKQVHAAVVKALKPGGVLILEGYTVDQLGRGTGGPKDAELMMSAAGLQNELQGLEIVQLQEVVRPIIEGKGHTGDGAVVQLIAKKPD